MAVKEMLCQRDGWGHRMNGCREGGGLVDLLIQGSHTQGQMVRLAPNLWLGKIPRPEAPIAEAKKKALPGTWSGRASFLDE